MLIKAVIIEIDNRAGPETGGSTLEVSRETCRWQGEAYALEEPRREGR